MSPNLDPDVKYGLEIIGDVIPGREAKDDSSPRYSPLQDKIRMIVEEEQYHGKWVSIADYGNGNVASGSMRDLKRRYGEIPEINGMSFTTHRYAIIDAESQEIIRRDDGKVVKRCKLLVKYEPRRINQEKKRQWERDQIMIRGREAAIKLGIDVDNISPSGGSSTVNTLLPPGHPEKEG